MSIYQGTEFGENYIRDTYNNVEKYDNSSYDNIEKTLDIMTIESDNIMKEYIITYISDEDSLITYTFNDSTKNVLLSNELFLRRQVPGYVSTPDDDNDDINKLQILDKELFNPINFFKFTNSTVERNEILKRRYVVLQEKIIKSDMRRNISKKKFSSMKAVMRSVRFIGFVSGVAIFCFKICLIANLTNPVTWVSLLSNIYLSPVKFQMFIDFLSYLKIFSDSEILTLKDLFLKTQLLLNDPKTDNKLLKDPNYVKTLLESIFDPKKADTFKTLSSKFPEHDPQSPLVNFYTFMKGVIDNKNIFDETRQPDLKQDIFKSIYLFYNSPIGNVTLTSLKLALDSYNYISTNVDFFSKHKDADPTLLFKGIFVNSVNSLSFNTYNKIFVQSLLKKIIGENKDSFMILEIPFFGGTASDFFVTTTESFLNIQIKSTSEGYFVNLEKEAGYDPEGEKKKIEEEKKNNIESVIDELQTRGKKIDKYRSFGLSNEKIARILDKPIRPNDYKFFISRYIKNFYNFFQDLKDDPLLLFDTFSNFSFIFNITIENLYPVFIGSGITLSQWGVLTGFFYKSFIDFKKYIGRQTPLDIVPIDIIMFFFKLKYGNDNLLNVEIEQLRVRLINDIFSDFQTLLTEIQSVFFDSTLGTSINKYLEVFNDTILGNIFKISCNITRFFLNYSLLPKMRNKILYALPTFNFPIIETLNNKQQSVRLFTFINNKFSNLLRLIRLNGINLFKEKSIEIIKKNLAEFTNVNKIMYGTIIPYLTADGYYEWEQRLENPFKGNIIKYISKTTASDEKDKLEDYTDDILPKSESKRIESTYIIVDTESLQAGNYKVVKMEEIDNLLENLVDDMIKTNPQLEDQFKYSYRKTFSIFKTKGIITKDFSTTNIYYYYYYNTFMKTKDKSYKFNMKDFEQYLFGLANSSEHKKREKDPNYNGIELAIINNILLSLKRREEGVNVPDNLILKDECLKFLHDFLEDLSDGFYNDPQDDDRKYKLETQNISKDELVYNDAYMGVNLRHTFGFSPEIVSAKDFLNASDMLQVLVSDESSDDIVSLSQMITTLETESLKDKNILFSLNHLNQLYLTPVQKLGEKFNSIITYFKAFFCNKYTKCNRENNILFKHLGFDYSAFYDKITVILKNNNLLDKIQNFIGNEYISEYFKNNSEIQFRCVDNEKVIYLNKNNINMDTGDVASSDCITSKVQIDYSNINDVLPILLRPETFFQLSNFFKDSKYQDIKKDIIKKSKIKRDKKKSDDFDSFFSLLNNIAKSGVKPTNSTSSITLYDIISDIIDEQEINYRKTETTDIFYKAKLESLFKFGKILKNMKKRFADNNIKESFETYFSQKEVFLDKVEVVSYQVNTVDKIIKEARDLCKDSQKNEAQIKNLVSRLKDDFFDKDALVGKINLNDGNIDNGGILDIKDIKTESGYFIDKLNNFSKFENELRDLKSIMNVRTSSLKDINICGDDFINIQNYVEKRKIWYDKQVEIYKLYVFYNSDKFYTDFNTRYDGFKEDVNKVINEYTRNLNNLYLDIRAKKLKTTEVSPLDIKSTKVEVKETKIEGDVAEQDKRIKASEAAIKAKAQARTNDAQAISNSQAVKEIVKETTDVGMKTEEGEDITTKNEEDVDEDLKKQLDFGSESPNPNHFGNFLDMLIKSLPSASYTNALTSPEITESEPVVEPKENIKNSIEQCESMSKSWFIYYDGTKEDTYTTKILGNYSDEEINGCKETNIIFNACKNINYFIITSSNTLLALLESIQSAICVAGKASGFFGLGICSAIKILLSVINVYGSCFAYIMHDVLYKNFNTPDMKDKLQSRDGQPHLGEKIVFSIWIQMINSLKSAEKMANVNRSSSIVCGTVLPNIYPDIKVNDLEIEAMKIINFFGTEKNPAPSELNLVGVINLGQIDENGLNYSNPLSLSSALLNFLDESENEKYETLIKNSDITCSDFSKFVPRTALKLSIYSLFVNPTKNLFTTYLSCRLFGTENITDISKISILSFVWSIMNMNLYELIKDLVLILSSNKQIRPFFLTKLFGNKSYGLNKNFIRDIIEDGFDLAEKKFTTQITENGITRNVLNQQDFEDYLNIEVSLVIEKFINNVANGFWEKIVGLYNYQNKSWVGLDKKIYDRFKICKDYNTCSIDEIKLLAEDAIRDVQTNFFNENIEYFFASPFSGLDDTNKDILDKIIKESNYNVFTLNPVYSKLEKDKKDELLKTVFLQYREILSFYNVQNEYNTKILDLLKEKFKTGKNLDMTYRVNNYNSIIKGSAYYKESSSLEKLLINPCPPNNQLIFFTANEEYLFECLDLSEFIPDSSNPNKLDAIISENGRNQIKFQTDYKTFVEDKYKKFTDVLSVLKKIDNIVCDNEMCKTKKEEFSDYIEESSKKLEELVKDNETDKINNFIDNLCDELKIKVSELNKFYNDEIKKILDEISDIEDKISNLNPDDIDTLNFLNDSKDELLKQKNYYQEYIENIIKYNKFLREMKTTKDLKSNEDLENEFILQNMLETTDPGYFSFLYFKYFLINDTNTDIFNLYELFVSDDTKITELKSSFTGNSYYIEKPSEQSENINKKILEQPFKKKILKDLKFLLSKSKKMSYEYTVDRNQDEFIVKIKSGDKYNFFQPKTGYDMFKLFYEDIDINPIDKGLEMNKKEQEYLNSYKEETIRLKEESDKSIKSIKESLDESGIKVFELQAVIDSDQIDYELKKSEMYDKRNSYEFLVQKEYGLVLNNIKILDDSIDNERKKLDIRWKELHDLENAKTNAEKSDLQRQRNEVEVKFKSELDELKKQIDEREKELTTNYNTSYYDTLEKNKKRLDDIDIEIEKLENESKLELDKKLEKINELNEEFSKIMTDSVSLIENSKMNLNKILSSDEELSTLKSAYEEKNTEFSTFKLVPYLVKVAEAIMPQTYIEYGVETASVVYNFLKRNVWGVETIKPTDKEKKDDALQKILGEIEKIQATIDSLKGEKDILEKSRITYQEFVGKVDIESSVNGKIPESLLDKKPTVILINPDKILSQQIEDTKKTLIELTKQEEEMNNSLNLKKAEYSKLSKTISSQQKKKLKEIKTSKDEQDKRLKFQTKFQETLDKNIIKRSEDYKKLKEEFEKNDEVEIKRLHTFGSSIKISFGTLNGPQINLYKNIPSQKGILSTTEFIQSRIDLLYRDTDLAEKYPLNREDLIVGNKVTDELPNIITDYPVFDSRKEIEEGFEKNLLRIGEIGMEQTIITKLRISEMIKRNYTFLKDADGNPVLHNGEKVWVMNTQIKLWEDTFADFDMNKFSSSLIQGFKDKETIVQQFQDSMYESLIYDKDSLDRAFGVKFNYFDDLTINGMVVESQKSINALRDENTETTILGTNIVESGILKIIPINIYQLSIYNTIFDISPGEQGISFNGNSVERII
jgi:hypothetical protein